MALAPAMAQNTMYAGQSGDLGVIEVPGDTYLWELYIDDTSIDFALVPGNCPVGDAYFTNAINTGPTVNVTWVTPGIYYFKVTAFRGGCTMNIELGMMTVLNALPTAVINPPLPICAGDPSILTVTLTGTAPWSITLSDGTSDYVFNNINSSPYTLTVPVNPTINTTYFIKQVSDAFGINTTPSASINQVVNPRPLTTPIFHH